MIYRIHQEELDTQVIRYDSRMQSILAHRDAIRR